LPEQDRLAHPLKETEHDQNTRYTIVGAGNGGRAMAAHLALMDFPVVLYNRTPEHVAAIKARGGIDLESYDGGRTVSGISSA
jgi:shikimate 5-dehydrogenase